MMPLKSPAGVVLRAPRGLAWHKDLVAWGTILAATIGTLYTVWVMLTSEVVRQSSRSSKKKRL